MRYRPRLPVAICLMGCGIWKSRCLGLYPRLRGVQPLGGTTAAHTGVGQEVKQLQCVRSDTTDELLLMPADASS